MNPRRLHSDTIFSINSLVFSSAIRGRVFLNHLRLSRDGKARRCSACSADFQSAISLTRRGDEVPAPFLTSRCAKRGGPQKILCFFPPWAILRVSLSGKQRIPNITNPKAGQKRDELVL